MQADTTQTPFKLVWLEWSMGYYWGKDKDKWRQQAELLALLKYCRTAFLDRG
jgi:hypothetical protein